MPTLACNLNCSYCYLGKQTTDAKLKTDRSRAESTLAYALDKLKSEGITAFNLSLHGGETTTLPPHVLEGLFKQINTYYLDNLIKSMHLDSRKQIHTSKTNLFKI